MSNEYVLEMDDISKSFPGTRALHQVNFSMKSGEIRALVGENGAGKSTLMSILGGIQQADTGTISINGNQVDIHNVNASRANGISIIHQEICLAQNLTIAENIFLGREPVHRVSSLVDFSTMNTRAQAILDNLNLNLMATMPVNELSIAQQQMVEIAKSLSTDAKIIVMDEPTSSLTESEVRNLLSRVKELKTSNVAIIYISHRMEEIFEIADSVTVLRDGEYVGTKLVKDLIYEELIRMMVGREIKDVYLNEKLKGGEDILSVQGLSNNKLRDVTFTLKKGEILGFSGLVGAGRTEVAKALFGIDGIHSGEIYLEGRKIVNKNPNEAIENGIVLVPEDRKFQGLILIKEVGFNLTIAILTKFINWVWVNKKKEKKIIDEFAHKLSIKMANPNQLVKELSGGNQQKVVISKWLAAGPKIVILDEPTRGIDIGAKSEIYQLMSSMVKSGLSIIMISSELPEVINMSSRIVVMHEGEVAKILDPEDEEVNQERIMYYATGGHKNDPQYLKKESH